MEAKIAAMKKRHEELCAQIKKVEAEQSAAVQGHQNAAGAINAKEQGVDGAENSVEAAKRRAALAKERLAKAEAAVAMGPKGLDAEAQRLKKEYEMAKEVYTKEANDVKYCQKRVNMAKAELAKWEQSSAYVATPAILGLVLLML